MQMEQVNTSLDSRSSDSTSASSSGSSSYSSVSDRRDGDEPAATGAPAPAKVSLDKPESKDPQQAPTKTATTTAVATGASGAAVSGGGSPTESVVRSGGTGPQELVEVGMLGRLGMNPNTANFIRTAKYTLLTFLPLNLFEQICLRLSNMYFLLMVAVSLIPNVSPLSPVTTITPVVFVLTVTAVKDGLEDYQRHKADKVANGRLCEAVLGRRSEADPPLTGAPTVVTVPASELRMGDIVRVKRDELFPADLVMLGSSLEEGMCSVETMNLDGETNLKRRMAPAVCGDLRTIEEIAALEARVVCEPPSIQLYRFQGTLYLEGGPVGEHTIPLSHTNLLLRGSQLRNTDFVYGMVLYVGAETKLFKNLKDTPSKVSDTQRKLNRVVLGIFILNLVLLFLSGILAGVYHEEEASRALYLDSIASDDAAEVGALHCLTYFVLYTYLIPISLFVTIELVRVGQKLFMEWDHTMASDPSNLEDTGMMCRNSNMNEQLGQIEHIFSDKTGTLTRNVMELAEWSVAGELYDQRVNAHCLLEARRTAAGVTAAADDPEVSTPILDYLRAVALCHTVVPARPADVDLTEAPHYEAESPDEAALVGAASENGVALWATRGRMVELRIDGESLEYELLAVLAFSSDRKRMSVIMRFPDGKIRLIIKGADNKILERLRDNDPARAATIGHLESAARDGLRTLLVAERVLDEDDYAAWQRDYDAALTALHDRDAQVEAVCERIECELSLLGATAVEDKLQDQVPETLYYLLDAGIHVWVLTGDKRETAENIGYSSSLLSEGVDLMRIIADGPEELENLVNHHLQRLGPNSVPAEHALIIDGMTLSHALDACPLLFLELGQRCQSVICCRVTPLQKAQVVALVKDNLDRVSLAIGDGANDVSMIQTAHVGVGVRGLEGTQAVRASDFAINEFRFLAPLICAHGRRSYLRLAVLIQYSFYKNIAFILPQFWFGFDSLFSGQVVYDEIILTTFNIFWAALPPLYYGLFERDLRKSTIARFPQAYREFQKEHVFDLWSVAGWLGSALYQGTLLYYLAFRANTGFGVMYADGQTDGMWVTATVTSTIGVITVLLKAALYTKHWNVFAHVSIWGSMVGYVLLAMFYMQVDFWGSNSAIYGTWFNMCRSPQFWSALPIIVALCLIPDFLYLSVRAIWWPNATQILREREWCSSAEDRLPAPTSTHPETP